MNPSVLERLFHIRFMECEKKLNEIVQLFQSILKTRLKPIFIYHFLEPGIVQLYS